MVWGNRKKGKCNKQVVLKVSVSFFLTEKAHKTFQTGFNMKKHQYERVITKVYLPEDHPHPPKFRCTHHSDPPFKTKNIRAEKIFWESWNILPWMAHCWCCQQRNNCLPGSQPRWGPDGDSWLCFTDSQCAVVLFSPLSPPPGKIHWQTWEGCVHPHIKPVIPLWPLCRLAGWAASIGQKQRKHCIKQRTIMFELLHLFTMESFEVQTQNKTSEDC